MQLATNGDESPRVLRLASQFLLDLAQVIEAEMANGAPLMPAEPGPALDEAPAPRADAPALDPAVVFAAPAVPTGTQTPAEAAAMARISAGGAGQGPTSFEATQPLNAPASPPPPPPPTVDAATAPAVNTVNTITTSSLTLDKDGLPHDERIHSVTPTLTASGVWRRRRNLDNPTLVRVEAELRARLAGSATATPGPAATVIPPPPPVIPSPPAVVVGSNAPAVTVMVPPPPPPPAGLPANDAGAVDPFRALMARIGGHTGDGGRLRADVMKPVHAEFGAVGWQDYVSKCRDQIPSVMARIDALLA